MQQKQARKANAPELARWMSEIRLRAVAQIAKLSRDLEKAEANKGHGAGLPSGGKTKGEQLAEAGISTFHNENFLACTGALLHV